MATVDAIGRTSLRILLLYSASLALLSGCLGSNVPVFIWSDERLSTVHQDDIKLGHTLDAEDVQVKYISPFLKEKRSNVVLFIQDELSIDDLAKYSSQDNRNSPAAFGYLKKALSDKSSVVLPSVSYSDESNSMVHFLENTLKVTKEEFFSSDVDSWTYPTTKPEGDGKSRLFVFHLPPVQQSSGDGKLRILYENDANVAKIMKVISKMSPHFTALLTAKVPSKFVQTHVQNDAVEEDYLETNTRRQLLSVSDEKATGFFNYSGCIFLYAKSIKFSIGKNTSGNLVSLFSEPAGQCSKNHSSIILSYSNGTGSVENLNITIGFNYESSGQWHCSSMRVGSTSTLNGTKQDLSSSVDCSSMIVPKGKSFSCGDPTYLLGNTMASVTFDTFQVQPFVSNNRFGNAFDCSPFFTIPILSALFTGLVLIGVVFFGLFGMMSIQATDRFDDPKAPSIHVAHE